MDTYAQIKRNRRLTFLLMSLFPLSLGVLVFLASIGSVFIYPEEGFISMGLRLFQGLFTSLDLQTILQNASFEKVKFISGLGYFLTVILPILGISFLWILIAYFFRHKMLLSMAKATPLPRNREYKKVYQSVENVAIMAGLPTPKVYIIDDDSLNAFASGRNAQTAAITLTTGIIKKLDNLELQAVIAHEMGHIQNRDVELTSLIITGLGIFTLLIEMVRLSFYSSPRRRSSRRQNNSGGGLVILALLLYIALLIFAYCVAPLIKMAISRTREYLADSTSALLTRNPKALASALSRISEDSRVEVLDTHPMMEIACIENPYEKKRAFSLQNLYATHPPIALRIKRLNEMAGF